MIIFVTISSRRPSLSVHRRHITVDVDGAAAINIHSYRRIFADIKVFHRTVVREY